MSETLAVVQLDGDAVPPEVAERALSLLTRWALRKTRKGHRQESGTTKKVVSIDCSKSYNSGVRED